MPTSTPPPSNLSPSPSSNGASSSSVWAQRLSWLISALSGTLEIEAAHEQEIEKLDRMILQTRNEKKQIEKENERLAELESKIDSSFSKHGINLPLAQIPEQP
jgi:hypothetical protein